MSVAVVEQEGRSGLVRRNVVLDIDAGETLEFEEAGLVTTDRDDLECLRPPIAETAFSTEASEIRSHHAWVNEERGSI